MTHNNHLKIFYRILQFFFVLDLQLHFKEFDGLLALFRQRNFKPVVALSYPFGLGDKLQVPPPFDFPQIPVSQLPPVHQHLQIVRR